MSFTMAAKSRSSPAPPSWPEDAGRGGDAETGERWPALPATPGGVKGRPVGRGRTGVGGVVWRSGEGWGNQVGCYNEVGCYNDYAP